MMTFGSLFAGIGGFDLGLERAGMQCKWQVEKDPFCQKVLAKHWPNVKRYEDIHDVKKPETVDLICGGFPCQPFSVAGKRKGTADDRYLWPEMLRVIREVRPSWVIGENVPGIIRMELDKVLSDLESEDYTCTAFIIPACAVDAPHRRDRVWIVAHNDKQYDDRSGFYSGEISQQQKTKLSRCKNNVSNPNRKRCKEQRLRITDESKQHGSKLYRQIISNPKGRQGKSRQQRKNASCRSIWKSEPDVGRVAHGVPGRVDRLRALGNAVVPQIVEIIGRMILDSMRLDCGNNHRASICHENRRGDFPARTPRLCNNAV